MKPRPLYLFEFWDHTDGDEPMQTLVSGYILKETSLYYVVTSWLVDGEEDEINDNSDKSCILKSTLIRKPQKLDSRGFKKIVKMGE